jgi:calcineurin-like phosphoesterase
MTGPHDGVIGVQTELVLTRFLRGVPVRFETATGVGQINGVLVEVDERTGKAVAIERVQVK